MRVQLIHGLEGSPQGRKARALEAAFPECRAPAMDTSDFEASLAAQAEVLSEFRPHVLVGSSFGGAVAVALLQRGLWQGPTLLLAQAAQRMGLPARLPAGVPVWLVHATADDIVPVADSRALAAAGEPPFVRLIEVEDDHALHDWVAAGHLVTTVRDIAEAHPSR